MNPQEYLEGNRRSRTSLPIPEDSSKIPLRIWPHQQRNLASKPSSSRIWPLKVASSKSGLQTLYNHQKDSLLNLNI